jgi:hypothetical protein
MPGLRLLVAVLVITFVLPAGAQNGAPKSDVPFPPHKVFDPSQAGDPMVRPTDRIPRIW